MRAIEAVVAVIVVVVMGLAAAARRYPDVQWLQAFQFGKGLSDAQRERMRRRANLNAGAQLILIGLALPVGYVVLTVMFFSAFTAMGMVLTAAGSAVCLGLGVTAIWRSRGS